MQKKKNTELLTCGDAKNADAETQEPKKTYGEAVQDYKQHISWAKDFFNI